MCIRRQVDIRKDAISLLKLARELEKNADLFTKEFYSSLYTKNQSEYYDSSLKTLGIKNFYTYFGNGETISSVPKEYFTQDINALEKIKSRTSTLIRENCSSNKTANYRKRIRKSTNFV